MTASRGNPESLVKFVVDSEHFPEFLASLFQLIQGLLDNDSSFVGHFVNILIQQLHIPEPIAKGIGAVADNSYAASLNKQSGKFQGFDPNIDALC